MLRRFWVWLAAWAVLGCSGKTPEGGLEVIITTSGLVAGTDFDAIGGIVNQETSIAPEAWDTLFDRAARVPGEIQLPTTIAIRAGTRPDQDAQVIVTALKDGQAVLMRTVQTQIPTDRVAEILIVLASDCLDKVCPAGESCQPQTATCASNIVDSKTLPTYTPGDENRVDAGPLFQLDAGNDASARLDAQPADSQPADAPMDVDAADSGVDAALPPSCAPGGAGMTNCGPGGIGRESCCTSLEVTGGTYDRTYANSGMGATEGTDPATVSSFRLDKYLVTVGRFRQFVNAWNGGGGYAPAAGSGKHTYLNGGSGLSATGGGYEPGWPASGDVDVAPTDANLASCGPFATWTPSALSQENIPINCASWYEAYAFCIWDGGFLPSEAEWEYAAAGGSEEREYPWGSIPPGTGSEYAIYNCDYPSGTAGSCLLQVGNIAPVGTASLGAGLWGQLDLAGEVYQWTLDVYGGYRVPCTDCATVVALVQDVGNVFRGGNFTGGTSALFPANRSHLVPNNRANLIGLRCARAP